MRVIGYLILVFSANLTFSQEGQFSQYYAANQLFNPAYVGTNPNFSLSSNFKRSSSKQSEDYFELMQASISYPLIRRTSKEHQIGAIGANFWKESRGFQGFYNSQKLLLTGAYSLKLSAISNQNLIFGLQGGVVETQLNDNNFQWGSQFSRYVGFDNVLGGEALSTDAVYFPVFNFGIVYNAFDNDNYFIRDYTLLLGASVDYLNQPKISSPDLGVISRSRIFKAFAYSSCKLAPRWAVSPTGYALYSDGSSQINFGLYFSTFVSSPRAYNSLVLQTGTWYRLNDSIILLAGLKFNEFSLGVSLDLNTTSFDINDALGANLPSYEISITYNIDLSKSIRNVSSPIF